MLPLSIFLPPPPLFPPPSIDRTKINCLGSHPIIKPAHLPIKEGGGVVLNKYSGPMTNDRSRGGARAFMQCVLSSPRAKLSLSSDELIRLNAE